MSKKKAASYSDRNQMVKELGYTSYAKYLTSDLWSTIRKMVYRRDKYKCVICKKSARCAHHIGYSESSLTGKNISKIVSLCKLCHENIEIDEMGVKRSLVESKHIYWEMFNTSRQCGECGKLTEGLCTRHSEIRKGKVTNKLVKNPVNKCKVCGKPAKKGKRNCTSCQRKINCQSPLSKRENLPLAYTPTSSYF